MPLPPVIWDLKVGFCSPSPELQPSKCPDHFLCHKQSTKATACLIKTKKVYRRMYPRSIPHTSQWDASYFCLEKKKKKVGEEVWVGRGGWRWSDGISNGSIITVRFTFWQKISRPCTPGGVSLAERSWLEAIRRGRAFNNTDAAV